MKFNGFSKELNEDQRRINERYNAIIDNIKNNSMKILSEAEQKNLDLLGSFNHKPSQQFLEFRRIIEEMYDLHMRKNNDYGSGNIGELGEKGIYVRMWDKISRLKELVWNEKPQKVSDESVDDTIMDLAVYSVIMLIYRRGKWGM